MFDLGGTIREFSPQQTLEKLKPLLLDTFGITRVANVTGLDVLGIPVSICIRPNSKVLATSQGKGISRELADISAIMESIESWHAENLPAAEIVGSFNQIKNQHDVVPLDDLLTGVISFENLDDRELGWTRCQNLITDRDIVVPYSMLSLNTTVYRCGQVLFPSTSNGLAAGNTRDEAICHGLFEVIERDAIAGGEAKRRVKLETICSAHNRGLIDTILQHDFDLYVWDITTELGVPAYQVELDDARHVRGLGLFAGYGCHLSKEVALSRAIAEAVQSRLTVISGARDDVMPGFYQRNVNRHAHYTSAEEVDFSEYYNTTLPDCFVAMIALLVDRLKHAGIKHIAVYDHTRESIGIPVVHVLVPGLQHDWLSHRMTRPA